jgi:hypothetical protein
METCSPFIHRQVGGLSNCREPEVPTTVIAFGGTLGLRMEKVVDNNVVTEKLDSMKARLRRRKSSERIRRTIESQLESKTRSARSREQPASAGYKRRS